VAGADSVLEQAGGQRLSPKRLGELDDGCVMTAKRGDLEEELEGRDPHRRIGQPVRNGRPLAIERACRFERLIGRLCRDESDPGEPEAQARYLGLRGQGCEGLVDRRHERRRLGCGSCEIPVALGVRLIPGRPELLEFVVCSRVR